MNTALRDIPAGEFLYARDADTGEYLLVWSEEGDLCAGPISTQEQEAWLVALLLQGDVQQISLPKEWKRQRGDAYGFWKDKP